MELHDLKPAPGAKRPRKHDPQGDRRRQMGRQADRYLF